MRVRDLRQLFNAIDPSFHERDLDPGAEEFIVNWSKDLPTDASLALVVYLERTAGKAEEAAVLSDAIHEFFGQRAAGSRRRLGELFRRGRILLAIGLVFLGSSIASATQSPVIFAKAASRKYCAKASSSEAGWRCGAHWKVFSMTGGLFVRTLACSID